MKFWEKFRNIPQAAAAPVAKPAQPEPFTMKRTGDDSAEITLYGDIVSRRPTDWYGDPIEGQYIILSEFLDEFAKVEDVAHLTVRIASAGGNAYDAMVIHNRLKAMAADVTVIVDGVAMSGGSLIMCAGDKVQVFPGSLIMIHRCWAFLFGGYNASELRGIVDSNEAVDRSQAAIYRAKTGIDEQELLNMMEAETYMTGQEAIDKGFADEMVEGAALEIAASADRRTLFAGAMPVWVTARKDGIPTSIPTVNPAASATVETNKTPENTGKGGSHTMANNVKELREEYPDLEAQVEAEAIAAAQNAGAAPTAPAPAAQPAPSAASEGTAQSAAEAERQRIREIDEVAALFDDELVQEAKYGDNPCTAQELSYRAAQKAAKQGHGFLAGMKADNQAAKAGEVAVTNGGSNPNADPNSPEAMAAQATADVAVFNTMKEVR